MTARIVYAGFALHIKALSRSVFFVSAAVLEPILLVTLVLLMARVGDAPHDEFAVALGGALVGMWSTTVFGGGTAIQSLRYQGVLPLVMCTPAPLLAVLGPLCLAASAIGVYSLVATLAWAILLFGVRPDVADPVGLVVALATTVSALAALGLLMATAFVHLRNASAIANALEFPIWLLSGFFVPLATLPGWIGPVSWTLAPAWGAKAVHSALEGRNPVGDIALCAAVGLAYLVTAAVLLRAFDRAARGTATLALA
jgi:ABC-2 type transport system permease protein